MEKIIDQNIVLAVDGVVFTVIDNSLHVLLIQRIREPYREQRSIPGGIVGDNETLEQAIYRKLQDEANVSNVYVEQLYTFSEVDRDPRGRTVSSVYMTVVNRANIDIKRGKETGDVKFFPVDELGNLAFDHNKIIEYAYQRLRYKLEYTNVAQFLLPESFTLKQLQNVYEVVLQETFDTRNFRKKIHQLGLIEETGLIQQGVKHRPAKLYQFVTRKLEIMEVV